MCATPTALKNPETGEEGLRRILGSPREPARFGHARIQHFSRAKTSAAYIPHRRRRRTHRKAPQDEGEDYRRRTLLLGLLAAGNPLPHQLASGAKSRSETRRRVSRGSDLPLFHSAREKRSSSVVPAQPPPLLAF